MQKKIFLQRNIRKGAAPGNPPLKHLVLAAVCLILLVLATSYLFKEKRKDVTKRPVPDRATVTKEVPKAVEPAPLQPAEMSRTAEPVKPQEAKPPEAAPTSPEAVKPPEPDAGAVVSQKAAPVEVATPEPARPVEPGPKDLFPKKSSPFTPPPAMTQPAVTQPAVTQPAMMQPAANPKEPAKAAAKAAGPAPAAKPAAPAGKGDYAVQVGTTFKDKSEAEKVRRDLAGKGYTTVIRPAGKGAGFSVTTSPTGASKAYTLQEQMKIQGVSSTTVIRVASGLEPPQKPASKKSKAAKPPGSQPASSDE
jgi:cell division protein FtsN